MRRVCKCKVRAGINQSKEQRDGYRGWVETIALMSWVGGPNDMIGRTILYPSLDVKARVQCVYYFVVEGRRCERGGEGGVDDWESET